MNQVLEFATEATPGKIAALRRTRATVTMPGTWVYVMWSWKSSKVYIGQTGGKGCVRTVFERFRDHILDLLGRDWALLDKWSRTFSVPLYEWVRTLVLENVCITPLEFCSAANVDARERYWMRVFGTSSLLNRRMPSVNHDKWRWLYKIKNAVRMAKSQCDTGKESLRVQAEKFLSDRRSMMSLDDQFSLMVHGKRFLPEYLCPPGEETA